MTDQDFMKAALAEAEAAFMEGEVPIGAVAVKEGIIVASAHNLVERNHSVACHAEFGLLHKLEQLTGDWRMSDFTFYVTKEPCPMCAGMLINARAGRVVFGAPDCKGGAFGGAADINSIPGLLWHCEVTSNVLGGECAEIIQRFFRLRRRKIIQVQGVYNGTGAPAEIC